MTFKTHANTVPWARAEIKRLFALPFPELLYQAQTVHRQFFPKSEMQISTLLSIKTGACPEDCQYCPQSGHYQTGLKSQKLLPLATVIAQATAAKAQGATRFCMGAAWRSPPKQALPQVQAMIRAVKALGLETCMTLGMLELEDAAALKTAGLDYYNHNLDSSPEFYQTIISTRTYQDRLDTLSAARQAGLKVCCGGIVGMGETEDDRIGLLEQLASLPEPPESIPINQLIPIKGTPLADAKPLSGIDLVKTIAVARIVLPTARIRLSAGREQMSDELQTLCFVAGANSIFYGEQLLTAGNASMARDQQLLAALGIARAP